MKSIDKLRKFVKDRFVINSQSLNSGMQIADEIEAEIAERYMELPADADGVPIHVGDVMMDGKTPRYAVAVAPESFMMDGYETGSFYRPGLAKNHRHVKPRTLEDVLIDMLETAVGYSDAHTDVALVAVESYADEIRELLGGDA